MSSINKNLKTRKYVIKKVKINLLFARLSNEVVELKSLNVKHLKVAESVESSRAELERQLSKYSEDIRDMKNEVRDRDERIKFVYIVEKL